MIERAFASLPPASPAQIESAAAPAAANARPIPLGSPAPAPAPAEEPIRLTVPRR
jgi:hypothetical protein